MKNHGKRSVFFKDGQKIDFNFCYELYNSTFFGTPRHESLGEIKFTDNTGLECIIKFANVKKK